MRDLRLRPVIEKRGGNWIDVLPTTTKQYNNRIHTSTKLSPKYAYLERNEGIVHKILLDRRNKVEPKFRINDLVRTADLKKTFSQRDTTNWSYKLYKITEFIFETIPS